MSRMKPLTVFKHVTNITSALLITISSMGSALLIPQVALAASATVQVTPTNLNGWYARPNDLVTGGTVKYVTSSDAPIGTGALELGTSSSQNAITRLTHPAGVALSSVTNLSYATKQLAAADPTNGNATLRVSLSLTGGTTQDEQLMYEPYYNGFNGIAQTNWKTWDLTQGKFWSNFGVQYGSLGGNVGSGGYETNFTLANVLSVYPDARVVGLILSMGDGNPSQQILIDNVKLNDTTYDFEAFTPPSPGQQTQSAVLPSDLALSSTGWYYYDDNAKTNAASTANIPGTHEITANPTPTLGNNGAIKLDGSNGARNTIATNQYAGTNLRDVAKIGFSTYQPNTNAGGTSNSPFMNFNVDLGAGLSGYHGRLVYVPETNASPLPVQNSWQDYEGVASNGQWNWSYFVRNGNKWPDGSTAQNRSWNDIISAFPNAKITNQLLVRSGEPYANIFSAYIDHTYLATTTNNIKYNFEIVVPDITGPTITDLTVTNNALWGAGYDISSKPNHLSEATGLPVVGGTVQIGANFNDDRLLTNIISYLPGRGFFTDNEYTPTPVNNNSWTGVAPDRYAVNWDTKNGSDWRTVTDGTYSFNFNARDGGNGQNGAQNNTYSSTSLTVDNNGPSVNFVSPTPDENALVSGTISVDGMFTDANGLMNTDIGVHNDGREGEGWKCHTDWPTQGAKSCQIDTTQLSDGTYKLTMAGRDKAGNVTQVFRTISVDNTAPVAAITAPTSALLKGIVTIGGTVSDVNPGHYYFVVKNANGTVIAGPGVVNKTAVSEWSWNTAAVADGKYTIDLEARDKAGNKDNTSIATMSVTIDNALPTVSISSPSVGQVLSVNSTDNMLGIFGTVQDDGFNYYYCYVTNAAGEVGIRDPQCVTSWSLGAPFHSAFAQTATGTSNGLLGKVDMTGLGNGAYTAHVVAYDLAGNVSETSTQFVLDNKEPITTPAAAAGVLGDSTSSNAPAVAPVAVTTATTPLLLDESVVASNIVPTVEPAIEAVNNNGKVKGDNAAQAKSDNTEVASTTGFLGLGWWWLPVLLVLLGIFWFVGASLRHKRTQY